MMRSLQQYKSSTVLTTGVQLITSAPPVGSPLAYDEDEIASLIKQVYDILLSLSYLKPSQVTFPPTNTGRHMLDTALFHDKVHIGTRVISLLERLPYIAESEDLGLPIFYEAIPIDYLEQVNKLQHIIETRDPENRNRLNRGRKRPHRRYLRPEDVALTYPVCADGATWTLNMEEGPSSCSVVPARMMSGATWILDVEANSIRILDGRCEPPVPGVTDGIPSDFELERPSEPHHYRNFPAFHAPTVLRRYIEHLRSLKLIPIDGWIPASNSSISNFIIARKLREKYGWPDSFEAAEWAEDWERALQEAYNEEDRVTDGLRGEDWEEATQRWCQAQSASSLGDGQ